MTAAQQSSAARILASKGQSVTLAYVGAGDGTYDTATGEATNTAIPPATVMGALFPLSPYRKSVGNIAEGDQQCLLSALDTSGAAITAPQVNGTVTDANGKAWTIIATEPLAPAGLAIMHDCVVRRAA